MFDDGQCCLHYESFYLTVINGPSPVLSFIHLTFKMMPMGLDSKCLVRTDLLVFVTVNLSSVTSKNCQISIKVAPKCISLENLRILTTLQKLPKNVGDLGKLIVAIDFEKLPKV